jgi:hypothetical protein
MAAWLAALALAAAATAGGFDHVVHEGQVIGAGNADPACSDCHTVDKSGAVRGAPGHAQCFGSCHGDAPDRLRRGKPYAIAGGQRVVCATCHAPDDLEAAERGQARKLPAAYPPYSIDPDHALQLSHAAHGEVTCQTCHAASAKSASAKRPHARCTGCHGKPEASPPMSECRSCHPRAFGDAASGPQSQRGAFPVTAKFDHERHRGHVAAGSRDDCAVCHADVAQATGGALPAPSMTVCASCHDGTKAFDTVGTSCRKCHVASDARPVRGERLAFSHGAHGERGMEIDCDGCHSLANDGTPLPPASNHRPCANDDCHASDFSSAAPKTCGTCHVGNEPWRPLAWFPLPRGATEFGAEISHASHAGSRPKCNACHDSDGARMPVSRGHAACTGSDCHGGSERPLSRCQTCHTRGLVAGRDAAAGAATWSVRARFRHDRHSAECEQCHTDVAAAPDIAAIAAPAKPRCASCHDGGDAFKMTGHDCARCHGK